MNAPETFLLPDVQSAADSRALAIDRVGIRGLVAPMHVSTSAGGCLATVVTAEMCVHLPADSKGTHMSRFLEILQSHPEPLDMTSVRHLMARMLERLGARAGSIDLAFPYFVSKRAPVSGVSSLMDYQVRMIAEVDLDGSDAFTLQVTVPVTSLCPCSKEISDYGAHNQRSHITIRARLDGEMSVEELVRLAEDEASCELFGLLKRPDEKWVTERAYDNPKFVEDLVRDIALRLDADARIAGYVVESENFESIHNHSAYARIERDRRTARR